MPGIVSSRHALLLKRTESLGNLGTQVGNLFIQGINVGQLFADQHVMVRLEPPEASPA